MRLLPCRILIELRAVVSVTRMIQSAFPEYSLRWRSANSEESERKTLLYGSWKGIPINVGLNMERFYEIIFSLIKVMRNI